MKKTIKTLFCALIAALAFTACEDVPMPEGGYTLPNPGDDVVTATEVTCAEAANIVANLADGETTAETYCITGYITDVFATISKNQQSFWISDNNDGQKIIQAYWANLPEGVSAFTKGSKVKITGKLLKYVKDGKVTPEVKNADVEILTGDDTPSDAITATCAEAANIASGLADNGTSAETYSVTGYITDVFATISRGQQSFWMADTKDGGKVLQAYWANLPAGVSAFTKGMKVTITGQIIKYVKGETVTPEIKNADVKILEAGEGGDEGDEGDDTPPTGEASDYSIDLPYTLGANAYDNGAATINGASVDKTIKIGTSSKVGDFNLTVPAGKLTFYAITWKGAGTADVKIGDQTVTVKANDGATGNAPYTITVTDADQYEIDVPAATTLNITSDKRIIFFGIKMK